MPERAHYRPIRYFPGHGGWAKTELAAARAGDTWQRITQYHVPPLWHAAPLSLRTATFQLQLEVNPPAASLPAGDILILSASFIRRKLSEAPSPSV